MCPISNSRSELSFEDFRLIGLSDHFIECQVYLDANSVLTK